MTLLNTDNPYALRFLLDDTIYTFGASNDELTDEAPSAKPEQIPFRYLGKNEKNILYLVENERAEYFSPAAHEAFTKTILALGLSMDDIAVLNLSSLDSETSFETLSAFFMPSKVVLAGPPPQRIVLSDLSLNHSTQIGQVKFLYTYSFEEMLTDINKKKIFWQSVKTL